MSEAAETLNRTVYCRKCGFANPAEAERCRNCQHSLYVICHCGARNERVRDSCHQCGEHLRRRRDSPENIVVPFPECSSGSCNLGDTRDLEAALVMFLIVAIIFAAVYFIPKWADAEEQAELDRQEMILNQRR